MSAKPCKICGIRYDFVKSGAFVCPSCRDSLQQRDTSQIQDDRIIEAARERHQDFGFMNDGRWDE